MHLSSWMLYYQNLCTCNARDYFFPSRLNVKPLFHWLWPDSHISWCLCNWLVQITAVVTGSQSRQWNVKYTEQWSQKHWNVTEDRIIGSFDRLFIWGFSSNSRIFHSYGDVYRGSYCASYKYGAVHHHDVKVYTFWYEKCNRLIDYLLFNVISALFQPHKGKCKHVGVNICFMWKVW